MTDTPEDLTALDPRHVTVLRIEALLGMVPILIGAVIAELAADLPTGVVILPALLLTAVVTLPLPKRRYRRKGYSTTMDRLRFVKGWFRKSDTVVPFGRVQHIDVKQGLVERWFGLATLVVHTAGTHNASVSVPGLSRETAVEVREAIAARIRRDTM
ncbi:PH domain-containing protein [Croceicoccus gelatinilyticus]|uniref:PH domain-containing protein n=1 Tax=Croceicoccus gelatinilyticus TaxID=2835536 RepID=UPI001BCFFFE5|nr:PH domain-containing protein [Croceicoccus gelatinilyticus]MBS7670559.1 PH domain-containing protein [Croceicoccus gelatinilyticus]